MSLKLYNFMLNVIPTKLKKLANRIRMVKVVYKLDTNSYYVTAIIIIRAFINCYVVINV